ncbi:hypothetical protein MY10362_005448, partial [Beauveria mimosiformis]
MTQFVHYTIPVMVKVANPDRVEAPNNVARDILNVLDKFVL